MAANSQPSPCGRADKSLARSGSDFRGGVNTSPVSSQRTRVLCAGKRKR